MKPRESVNQIATNPACLPTATAALRVYRKFSLALPRRSGLSHW
jgi:hypothetical protein